MSVKLPSCRPRLARRLLAVALLGVAAPFAGGAPASPATPEAPVPASAPRPARLPAEAWAKLPLLSQVTLSRDGNRLAAVMNRENDSFIVAGTLGADHKPLKPIWKPSESKLRIGWIRWVGDRLLVSVSFPAKRYDIETTETRLVSMKADGSDVKQMFPREPGHMPPQIEDGVIDDLGDGRHVLVEIDGLHEDAGFAVYRLDVETAERDRVQPAVEHVVHWVTDQQHRVRAAVRLEDTTLSLLVRPAGAAGDGWRRLFDAEVFSRGVVHPLGFGPNPDELYVSADHDGRDAVLAIDLASPDLKRTLKLADDRFDASGSLVVSPRTHEVVGVRAGLGGKGDGDYWDEGYRSLGRGLARALPGRTNTVLSLSDDERRYLVYSEGNGAPGEYYLGDTTSGSLDLLARTYPQLPAAALARKVPVTLHARDGLALPSLLTLPVGSTGRNLPAVVLPHGGPLSSDELDFDPWSQFLANRGIAVLQVNFRGSTGFGHDLMAAGLKRWGLEMQDDITDATQWLVASGVADPKRVCIVGGSYGGYAALMGAAKTPDLYRCAVSFAGVSDLYLMVVHEEDYANHKIVEKQIASREGDLLQMRRTSPRYLADQVKVPVLLVHGTQDRVVPIEQSEVMADALKSAGKPVRYVVQEGGDHHLSRYDQNLQFFQELDRFLGEQLQLKADAP